MVVPYDIPAAGRTRTLRRLAGAWPSARAETAARCAAVAAVGAGPGAEVR